jgi:hypothetical protein
MKSYLKELPSVVQGIWKFRDTIGPEDLGQTAHLMRRENPARFQELTIRRCSKDQLGICFTYRLAPEGTETSLLETLYREFRECWTDAFKRQYGNSFVGYDVTPQVWQVL